MNRKLASIRSAQRCTSARTVNVCTPTSGMLSHSGSNFVILCLISYRGVLQGNRRADRTQNYSIERLAALEARAMKRTSFLTVLYLPMIFFGYGTLLGTHLLHVPIVLQLTSAEIDYRTHQYMRHFPSFITGTVYLQTTMPFLIMSGFCVYSVASALFMFPAMYTFYTRALEIYTFEHADGSGRATDLVIQPFVRFISMAFFPVVVCAGVLYILVRTTAPYVPLIIITHLTVGK